MEAAFKNLGDEIDKSFTDVLELAAPVATDFLNNLTEIIRLMNNPESEQFAETVGDLTTAFMEGIITQEEYIALQADVHRGYMTNAEAAAYVAEKEQDLIDANVELQGSQEDVIYSLIDSTANFEEFKAAAEEAGVYIGIMDEELYNSEKALREAGGAAEIVAASVESAAAQAMIAAGDYEQLAAYLGITTKEAKAMTDAWAAAQSAHEKMVAEMEKITTLDANYKGIIDLAYQYSDMLEEITENQRIMAEEPVGSEKYVEAKTRVEELQGAMQDLANQVVLDMFQATIAIGGVTEAELGAYMQLATDMG